MPKKSKIDVLIGNAENLITPQILYSIASKPGSLDDSVTRSESSVPNEDRQKSNANYFTINESISQNNNRALPLLNSSDFLGPFASLRKRKTLPHWLRKPGPRTNTK